MAVTLTNSYFDALSLSLQDGKFISRAISPSASDASNSGPAINKMFYCTPIVNETGTDDFGYYWTSTSAHFTTGKPYYYSWYVAFGMAVNGEGADFHGAGAVRFDTKEEGGPLGEGVALVGKTKN